MFCYDGKDTVVPSICLCYHMLSICYSQENIPIMQVPSSRGCFGLFGAPFGIICIYIIEQTTSWTCRVGRFQCNYCSRVEAYDE